jgi:hypothetical protein
MVSLLTLVNAVVSRLLSTTCITAVALCIVPFASAQTETVIHSFGRSGDGSSPSSGLVADSQGALYGVTDIGGLPCSLAPRGCGIVFRLTPPTVAGKQWNEHVLYSFTGGLDGGEPIGNLLIDSKSNKIYGTTQLGGADSTGVLFELAPGSPWAQNVVHSFNRATEGVPDGGNLIFYRGRIVGATSSNGVPIAGLIYAMTPPIVPGGAWTQKVLYTFTCGPDGNGSPFYAGLVADSSGALYGTTDGCPGNSGTVFRLNPPSSGSGHWTVTTLYRFTGGVDGADPEGTLALGTDGSLYGTTNLFGTNSGGAVFRLTPPSDGNGAWTFATLYSPNYPGPQTGVAFDSTGALYGTTPATVFKLTPSSNPDGPWTSTILHTFLGGHDGYGADQSLLLLNEKIYGTTMSGGGQLDLGTAFELIP